MYIKINLYLYIIAYIFPSLIKHRVDDHPEQWSSVAETSLKNKQCFSNSHSSTKKGAIIRNIATECETYQRKTAQFKAPKSKLTIFASTNHI
jgi:hypothetical protein